MRISKSFIKAIFILIIIFASILSLFIVSDEAFSLNAISKEQDVEPLETDSDVQPDLPAGNYYIAVSYNNLKVLDVTGGGSKDGTNIELFKYNLATSQKFNISYDDKGYATIKNYAGKVLDVAGGFAKSGANVIQFKNNNTINQKWIISKDKSGLYKITSALSENGKNEFCLDVWGSSTNDGANIQIYKSGNTSNQRFNFIPIDSQKFSGTNELEDGNYYIKQKTNTKFCAEVNGSNVSDCANVQLWSLHGSQNQIFHFTYEESTGCYIIYNVNSNKVLNVDSSNPFSGANVIQFQYTNDDNERWALSKRTDDGSWKLKNRHTGLVLDIAGGRSQDGTNISTYPSHDGTPQRFELVETKLLNEGIYFLKSFVSGDRNVEVPCSSWDESLQLVTYSYSNTYNHKFSIKYINSDEFIIRSVISGKLIAQKNNKVIQTDKNDNNSRWKLYWSTKGLNIINSGNNLYMDVSNSDPGLSTPIITKDLDYSKGESFSFIKTDLSTVGVYNICPACNLGNSLNINGGSWWCGAQIFSWNGYDDSNCKWFIECVGGNLYRIVSDKTGYVVDVSNGSCHDLDQIQQYSWNGGSPQLWWIEFSDDGWLNFVNATNGLMLDCFGQNTYSGAPVGLFHRNGANSQNWRLHLTTPVTFSGNAELDGHLRNICRGCPSLDSAYNFVAGFPYRNGDLWPGGDWTVPYALDMIYNWSGNCYRYAALFMWCARALGYNANVHCGELGTIGGGRQAHGWVEIYDGGTYVCDPELQYMLGQYNFYMITYSNAPVIYYP